jgi:hypothetical protein
MGTSTVRERLMQYGSNTNIFAVGLAAHQGKAIQAYEIVGSALDAGAQVTNNVLTVKTLLTPLSQEEIKVVRCLGLNYSDHAVCALELHSQL